MRRFGGRANAQDFSRLLDQVPATLDAELREQGRDMKFHGADGNVQATGYFLVDAIAEQLEEDFILARAERYRGGEAASETEKLLGLAGHAASELIVCGNADGVVGGRIAAHGAGESEQAG